MTSEKTINIEQERMLVLLGLAGSKPKPSASCPQAEQLSAFIDGRLSGSQRQAILAHLNSCEPCYQEWLSAALAAAELKPEPTPSRWQKGWQKFIESCRAPWTLPLAAALTASLVIAAIVIQKPTEEIKLPELYATVKSHAGLEQALPAFSQAQTPALAFSESPQEAAKQAFAAGMQTVRHWLEGIGTLEEAKWPQSSWRDYYDLGQWALLTLALARAEGVPPREWQIFERHCQSLIRRFERRTEPTAQEVLPWLREAHALLQDLVNRPDPTQAARLARSLQLKIQQFLI